MTAPAPENCKINRIEPLFRGGWLHMDKVFYETPDGEPHTWEFVTRNHSVGAVVLIARCVPSNTLLLVKQFRPPVNKLMLEFPAGLIDPGESPAQAALRELREETGYHGTITRIHPISYSSPGLTSEYFHFIEMEVNEHAPENQTPKTDFDPSECIVTLKVQSSDLMPFIKKMLAEDVGCDAKLMMYALAFQNLNGCQI